MTNAAMQESSRISSRSPLIAAPQKGVLSGERKVSLPKGDVLPSAQRTLKPQVRLAWFHNRNSLLHGTLYVRCPFAL